MKNLFMGLVIGLTLQAALAKQLPELCDLRPRAVCLAIDYNVLVAHIQELERKVAGMQKQITLLHAVNETK